jgi:hypothetical protein
MVAHHALSLIEGVHELAVVDLVVRERVIEERSLHGEAVVAHGDVHGFRGPHAPSDYVHKGDHGENEGYSYDRDASSLGPRGQWRAFAQPLENRSHHEHDG